MPGFAGQRWWLVGALIALLTASSLWAQRFEGVASCAGSTCHGRAEGNGAVVRQDELRLWQEPSSRGGAHSRAYAALLTPRGQRIAGSLGLGAAGSAPACLGCHATPAGARGDRFQLSDGVGCETCHGAASGWIASHYSVGASHAGNIANGMIPLDRPQVRAGVCLDCHLGSGKPGQFVTHAMMAAGHPRISYELDLFSSLQQHWDDDPDYRERKDGQDSVRLWAVGQAEAVQRSLSLFARGDLASNGVFPELTFFDCHSCHRRIDDNPDRQRTFETNPGRPIEFGQPPYNDENIIMLSAVAHVLAPGQANGFMVDPFHQAPVARNNPCAVINQIITEMRVQMPLSQCHADGCRQALTQRACGGFNAIQFKIFWMTGAGAVQLAEMPNVIHRRLGVAR